MVDSRLDALEDFKLIKYSPISPWQYHGFKVADSRGTVSLLFMGNGPSNGAGMLVFSFLNSGSTVYVSKSALMNVTVKFYKDSSNAIYCIFSTPQYWDTITITGFTCFRNMISEYASNSAYPSGATELTQIEYNSTP